MYVRECEGRGLYLNSGLQVWQQAPSHLHSPSDIIFFFFLKKSSYTLYLGSILSLMININT